jgi:hypothetical protein
MKGLDFATRRELQRKEAAEKRRQKMKCYLCGQAGHVRRECPGVMDDGRGMSRYKNKSNVHDEKHKHLSGKIKTVAARDQRGRGSSFGSQHDSGDGDGGMSLPMLDYPEAVLRNKSNLPYYDVSCDIDATIEFCKHGRGKNKISLKEAIIEYRSFLEDADDHTNFFGMISKSVLKPNRPWSINTSSLLAASSLTDPECESMTTTTTSISFTERLSQKTWYMIGLSRDFLVDNNHSGSGVDDEMESTINLLIETLDGNKDVIVGYWTVLDYTVSVCDRRGYDVESQKRRLVATCTAAGRVGVTVQLQVLPGASSLDDTQQVARTEYAQALLSLHTILLELTTEFPDIQIVLADWYGLAPHMLSLLAAFPKNVIIGFDATLSFAKATYLHECAFEVPLDKFVLMTSTTIPATVANAFGRDAFFHSGLWPFVAVAMAHYKKTTTSSIEDIVQASYDKTIELYPQLQH